METTNENEIEITELRSLDDPNVVITDPTLDDTGRFDRATQNAIYLAMRVADEDALREVEAERYANRSTLI